MEVGVYYRNIWILLCLFCCQVISHGQDYLYRGGTGDGYSSEFIINNNSMVSFGGQADGYAVDFIINNALLVSLGGQGDGYDSNFILNGNTLVSFGGQADGYANDFLIRIFWTGDVSTSWSNTGNWTSNTIPVNSDMVIIPSGRPRYPFLGNQPLSIGDPSILSGYRCDNLWIQANASVTSSSLSTLLNWSTLTVDGTLIWNNQSAGSFLNKPGAKMTINAGGSIIIK